MKFPPKNSFFPVSAIAPRKATSPPVESLSFCRSKLISCVPSLRTSARGRSTSPGYFDAVHRRAANRAQPVRGHDEEVRRHVVPAAFAHERVEEGESVAALAARHDEVRPQDEPGEVGCLSPVLEKPRDLVALRELAKERFFRGNRRSTVPVQPHFRRVACTHDVVAQPMGEVAREIRLRLGERTFRGQARVDGRPRARYTKRRLSQ